MSGEEKEIPLVNSTPDMNSILENATDIQSPQAQDSFATPPSQPQQPINPTSLFTNSQQVPNKFFNFLEDESANMSFDEQQPIFTAPFSLDSTPSAQTPAPAMNSTEDIELLDFSDSPSPTGTGAPVQMDVVQDIINKIRALNLNSDIVSVEEMNLPDEYYITIKIKKGN